MAALSTSRHNLLLRDLCQRLLRAGKPKKVALPAVMRKLLICLNVLLRQQPEQQDFFLQGPQQPSRSTRGEVQEKNGINIEGRAQRVMSDFFLHVAKRRAFRAAFDYR
jgi:hypothetical protein